MASLGGTLGLSDFLNPSDAMIRGTADRAAAAGQEIASQVLAGVSTTASSAFGAGVQISQSLLQGVMQPFGASGQAVTQFAGTITNSVQGLFESGLKSAGSLLQAGSSLVTTAGGLLATGVGAVIGLAFGPGGAAIGAAVGGGVALIVGQLVGVFTSALSGMVTVTAQAMGELGKVVGEGLNALLQVVQDVVQTSVQRAQSIGSLTYTNNMGWDNASSLFTRLSGFNVSAGAMGQMFGGQQQMPSMFGMRASAYNVSNYTDNSFLERLAARFQNMRSNGPIGVMQSNAMLNTMGINTPDMMRLLSLSPAKIAGQQNWMQSTQTKMGITPEMLRGFAEDFPLLTTRVGEFVEMIKVRFLGALMPFGERILDTFTNYLSGNADAIVANIEKFATYLINEFPVMLLSGLSVMFEFGAGFATFLQGMALTMATWLDQFQNGKGAMNFLMPLAQGLDSFLDTLSDFVVGFAYINQWMTNLMLSTPGGAIMNWLKGQLGLTQLQKADPMQVARNAYDAMPVGNFVAALTAVQNSGVAGQAAAALQNRVAPALGASADFMRTQQQNTQNAAQGWPQVVAQLQQSNQTLDKIAGNTKDTADALPDAQASWGAEIGSRIVRAHRAGQRRI